MIRIMSMRIGTSGGTVSRRAALVAALAIVLVFAFSATALADTTSGYITWSAAAPNNNPATPHKGYALTTTKCAVCHAAHKASATGEILLDGTAGNACVYCHITGSISTKKVYNSVATNYTTASDHAHNNACSECHSIHGANTIMQPSLSASILKNGASQTGIPATWNKTAGGADANGAMSAFCTQCHPYYTSSYAVAGTTGDINGTVGDTAHAGPYNAHIMTNDYALYGPANGGNSQASYNGQVAFAGTPYCISCHDAGDGTAANNFPHYTTGARFMKSATVTGGTASAAVNATEDGVCLKCHVNSSNTAGVGITY